MKLLIEHGGEALFLLILVALCFLGDGAVSYKTVGTEFQTNITDSIKDLSTNYTP